MQKIDALKPREKLAILALGVFAIVLPAESWLISPAVKASSNLKDEKALIIKKENDARQVLESIRSGSETKALQISLQEKKNELQNELMPKVDSARQRLISPNQVESFLRDIIAKEDGLKLIRLSSEASVKDGRAKDLWSHPFLVELEGSYSGMSSHIAKMKNSSWRLASGQMVLETQEKTGLIKMKLRISAFSDSQAWIADPKNTMEINTGKP